MLHHTAVTRCRLHRRAAAGIGLGIMVLMLALLAAVASAASDKKDPHAAHREANKGAKLAVGWGQLNYPAPVPGTYQLPAIHQLGDGQVLNSDGEQQNLADYYRRGKITVLSFIYTSCPDVNGCPLATFVMHSLKKGLRDNPDVMDDVQLISLSFDPDTDTPEVMKDYGRSYQHRQPAWFFLTTQSHQKLKPILDDFGQFVIADPVTEAETRAVYSHTLRVFLIDQQGRVRNIYSPDFLHRDILLADIRTLLMQS